MMLWIPALGGLVSGFPVFKFALEAQGHGTDVVMDTFHRKKGVAPKYVPIIEAPVTSLRWEAGRISRGHTMGR